MNLPVGPDSSNAAAFVSAVQRDEAAEWFVIIHGADETSGETLQGWLKWMDQNEGNRVAFESVVQAWHGTPESVAVKMPTALELLTDSYDGEQSVEQWLASRRAADELEQARRRAKEQSFRTRRRIWLAAASVAVAVAGTVAMNRYATPTLSQPASYATRYGEKIEVTLEDGSRVWLGPNSAMQVAFDAKRRSIQLTSGEAFFSVKKDPGRPFVVASPSGDITAVGTAFNVRALADHVIVSVTEGVVAVAPTSELVVGQAVAVRVASGQELTFKAHQSAQDLSVDTSAAAGERSRWRDGVLIYRDEPLREVVNDVARYSGDVRLELSGDAIGTMRYTGIVYASAVDEWASALSASFPVRVVSDGNRRTITAR